MSNSEDKFDIRQVIYVKSYTFALLKDYRIISLHGHLDDFCGSYILY